VQTYQIILNLPYFRENYPSLNSFPIELFRSKNSIYEVNKIEDMYLDSKLAELKQLKSVQIKGIQKIAKNQLIIAPKISQKNFPKKSTKKFPKKYCLKN
jgi:hypothetical protein